MLKEVQKSLKACPRYWLVLLALPLILVAATIGYGKFWPTPQIWVGTGVLRIPSKYMDLLIRQTGKAVHQDRILELAGMPTDLDNKAAALFRKSFAAKRIPGTTLVEVTVKAYNEQDARKLIQAALSQLLAYEADLGDKRRLGLLDQIKHLDTLLSGVVRQHGVLGKITTPGARAPGAPELVVLTAFIRAQISMQLSELQMRRAQLQYEHDTLVTLQMGSPLVTRQESRSSNAELTDKIWIGSGVIRVPSEYTDLFIRQAGKAVHQDRILELAGMPMGLDNKDAALFRKSFAAKHIPATTLVEITVKAYSEQDARKLINAALTQLLAYEADIADKTRLDLLGQIKRLDGLMSNVIQQQVSLSKIPTTEDRSRRMSELTVLGSLLETPLLTQLTALKMKQAQLQDEYDSEKVLQMGTSLVTRQVIKSSIVELAATAGLIGFAIAIGLISMLSDRRHRENAN
jgi:hypothetical protein